MIKQITILCLCAIVLTSCYDKRNAVVGIWGILRIDILRQGAELPYTTAPTTAFVHTLDASAALPQTDA